jgi:hypothetical protein
MSRLPDHLQPPAIVEQQKQSKFICSACGSARDCDCVAPAMERIAEIREQARQRKIKQRESEKAEQNQQSRHVTEDKSDLAGSGDGKSSPAIQQRSPSSPPPTKADLERATIDKIMTLFRQLDWVGRSKVIDLIDQFNERQLDAGGTL